MKAGEGWCRARYRSRTAIGYSVYGVPEAYCVGRDGRASHKHIEPVLEVVPEESVALLWSALRTFTVYAHQPGEG